MGLLAKTRKSITMETIDLTSMYTMPCPHCKQMPDSVAMIDHPWVNDDIGMVNILPASTYLLRPCNHSIEGFSWRERPGTIDSNLFLVWRVYGSA